MTTPAAGSTGRDHYQGREIVVVGADKPKFDGTSSYRQEFVQHPYEHTSKVSPPKYLGNNTKFDGTSTYGNEFVQHPLPERPTTSSAHKYNPLPFEGNSTYTDNYKPHALDAAVRHASVHWQPNNAKFDGTTSYVSDYPAHPLQGTTRASGAYATRERAPGLPFQGNSTYRDAYVPLAFDPANLPKNYALAAYAGNSTPFDGKTSYGEDFKAHALEPRPATSSRGGPYQTLPFEGTTTHRDAYQARPGEALTRQGPPAVPMRPSVPFDGMTTNKEAFKGWQMPARRQPLGVELLGDKMFTLIKPDAPLPATGKQMFTTVHDDQTEMCVLVLQGNGTSASGCNLLGQFDLVGLPAGPAGSARVEVTLHLDTRNVLSGYAVDLDSQRHERWLLEGAMVAR